MNIDYNDLLWKLAPYKDKVFFYPLTSSEVLEIESLLNKKTPNYYSQFLLKFGLRQDFVIGLIDKINEFKKFDDYLPSEVQSNYICIGNNRNEDIWLINAMDENDQQIYEWQPWYESKPSPLGFDFNNLLENSLNELKNNYTNLATNANKLWSVQFAIPTIEDSKLFNVLATQPLGEWRFVETSSAGVSSFATEIVLNNKTIPLSKLEYAEWPQPIYYFNYAEPIDNYATSEILAMDKILSASFEEYTLIDYGIMRNH